MPRQQRGLIGQRQDHFTDAAEQLSSVSSRILIIPTASFENGILHLTIPKQDAKAVEENKYIMIS